MRGIPWPENADHSAHMRKMKAYNAASSQRNANENWFAEKLSLSVFRFSRQACWGFRIYDFWSAALGVAIEIDGADHDKTKDRHYDEYHFRRSGIVVLRVRNGNEADADRVFALLPLLGGWKDRKERLGITGNIKKAKRALAALPFGESLLAKYLDDFS